MFDSGSFDLLLFDPDAFEFDTATIVVDGVPNLENLTSSGAIDVGNTKTVNGVGQLNNLTSSGSVDVIHVVNGVGQLNNLTSSGIIGVGGTRFIDGVGQLNNLTSSGIINVVGDVTLEDLQEQIAIIDDNVTAILAIVSAIQAKTDKLTFSSAGFVDANLMEVNDNGGLVGDGRDTPVGRG